MKHNTSLTLAALTRHLSLFTGLTLTVNEGDDSLRDDEPIDKVVINDLWELYPFATTEPRKTIRGTFDVDAVHWALDVLVDDSDPSVGLFGSLPEPHGDYACLDLAMIELARLIATEHVERSMEAENDERMAAEWEDEDRIRSEYEASTF